MLATQSVQLDITDFIVAGVMDNMSNENVIDGSDGVATLVLMSGDYELSSKPQVIAKITRNKIYATSGRSCCVNA
ncbi:hypothetical protein QL285_052321 [Trifolium repens]|nr:hypothetical protein QL285_052321 [Trifolium repens]